MTISLKNSLAVFGIWLALTIGLAWLLAGGNQATLADTVSREVGLNWLLAAGFLAWIAYRTGPAALGLQRPGPRGWPWLLWLPVAYLVLMLAIALVNGLPAPATVAIIAANAALVGFSEEVMTRGILFHGLQTRFRFWPSVVLSCLAFGLMHTLNAALTGDAAGAFEQAAAAFMAGFGFLALRIRTGSLYPGIVVHALWDFLLLLIAASPPAAAPAHSNTSAAALAPLLLNLPLFIYGVFLLRRPTTPSLGDIR